MSLKRATARCPSGASVCEAQLLDEPSEHPAHERREPEPREPVVERLVRDLDAVLVVERAEQIRERLDLRAGQRRDNRQEQPVGRDRAQPFGLPGRATELIDVLAREGAGQGGSDSGKLGDRQGGQRSLLYWLVW